jgi:ribonuclease T2
MLLSVLLAGTAAAQQPLAWAPPACPIDTPLSCSNDTPVADSCCFELPGGIMLQTQFWDYYPPVGPNDTFTLHGLWPDNCDGTYEQFCDALLNVANVTRVIADEFGDRTLVDKMRRIWKNFNGNDESLWMHEFNKHGTCIKTMRPQCYGGASAVHANVYDFFNILVNLFERYPTFAFLAAAGIHPSLNRTYTRDEIDAALQQGFGHKVYFKCNRYSALQEIWYFHHVQGSVRLEQFRPVASFLETNCPAEGIKFVPKSGFEPPGGGGGGGSRPDRGYIRLSGKSGCLISNGQWYGFGTCGTYTLVKLAFGGYNLKSSRGFCGLNAAQQLECHRGVSPAKFQFQLDLAKQLEYGGVADWCYDEAHRHGSGRFVQVPIKLGACGPNLVRLTFT